MSECEWAETYGDGTHVDMMNAGPDGPFFATCCEIGEIDGPCGNPVSARTIGEPESMIVANLTTGEIHEEPLPRPISPAQFLGLEATDDPQT